LQAGPGPRGPWSAPFANMCRPNLDILVIADTHHTRRGDVTPPGASRRTFRDGPLFVRKALLRLKHEGIAPGLIVLLGDLLEDGRDPSAEAELGKLAEELQRANTPFLVVPGNHDASAERIARIFGCAPGLHEAGGYGFLVFHDRYEADDRTCRSPDDLALPAATAAQRPGLPLIALQHNPLHPRIEEPYPYMPENAEAILASYRAAGVVLSLSGHYHAGQAVHEVNGTLCFTAPAACEAPYRFARVRLDGRRIAIRELALQMDVHGLVDVHCHTEMAYCRHDVAAEADAAVARTLGVQRVCLVEHAFQLYLPPEAAWSWRWQTDAAMVQRAFRGGRGRMDEYRRLARRLRSEFVRAGLEADLLDSGELFLAGEDRPGWDLIVGAIHAVNGETRARSQAEAERLFMRDAERLLAQPINVLAHPFRFFLRGGHRRPAHLYAALAGLLAARGVAAEINFHVNAPDPRFIEECLSRGVKLALGSDAHDMAEVGEFAPHLRVLSEAGVKPAEFARVLYAP